jgi:hypothetical protein
VAKFDSAYRKTRPYGTGLDVFTFNQLLDSSICGKPFNLDDPSTAPGADENETLRSSGFIISSPIDYINLEKDVITYKYIPAQSLLLLM